MSGRVTLVAHRGQPKSFPENSLQGFRHVIEAGAGYVETDVQISADGIPLLSHDAHLLKLTGKQIIIADHSFQQISELSAGYEERFGDRFRHSRIASLEQFSQLLSTASDVTSFIELKRPGMDNFGLKAVDLLLKAVGEILSAVVLICEDYDALVYARENYPDMRLGWVLPQWSDENRQHATILNPQYLFVDREFCPQHQAGLWPGPWQWVVYTVNTAHQVEHFASLGFELIETDRYSDLKRESALVDVSNDF